MKPASQSLGDRWAGVEQAVLDSRPVTGLTHQFYRYPARFSPSFARAVIEAFTEPGDLVLDPFVGGGTTAVEAIALGRLSVAADISALARFVSQVKTTPLTMADGRALRIWMQQRVQTGLGEQCGPGSDHQVPANLHRPNTWRVRNALATAISTVAELRPKRREAFARCVILKTAQWALDGRRAVPALDDFRIELQRNLDQMLMGVGQLSAALGPDAPGQYGRRSWCLVTSAAELHKKRIWTRVPRPKLILTSPPYVGIHVLYDRWQITGRRETSAPFWITASPDGHFTSYYTFGDRRNEPQYFASARTAFTGLAKLATAETVIVQLVGFADPRRQLPAYLELLDQCGFEEIDNGRPERIWRQVPNRKWHADQKGFTSGSQEVVLVHRLRS